MKKIKTIVILMLLMIPCLVKAASCGTYTKTYEKSSIPKEDSTVQVTIEKGIINVDGNNTEIASSECPKEIYYIECGGGKFAYSLNNYVDCSTVIKKIKFWTGNPGFIEPGKTESDKYSDIEECQSSTYHFIKECGCIPVSLTDLTRWLYFILKVMGPAIFVIIGAVELMKAMTAQDEKAVQGALNKLIKKLVAAVMIFFVLLAVQWVVELLAKDSEGTMQCVNYFLNGYKG